MLITIKDCSNYGTEEITRGGYDLQEALVRILNAVSDEQHLPLSYHLGKVVVQCLEYGSPAGTMFYQGAKAVVDEWEAHWKKEYEERKAAEAAKASESEPKRGREFI